MSTTEENRALSRRLREAADRGDPVAAFDEALALNVVAHIPGSPVPLGRETLKGLIDAFYSALPDLRHTFEDQIAEGDKVASRVTFRGTHRGEFQGILPTDREVTFSAIFIDRYSEGKIVEHWANFDALGMLQQLGFIPPPEQAGS